MSARSRCWRPRRTVASLLDSVYLDIKGLDGLRAEVDDAVAVGFDAKVAIHPARSP